MNAELLRAVMGAVEDFGEITKVTAIDNDVYIDGKTYEHFDEKPFNLSLNFKEKE